MKVAGSSWINAAGAKTLFFAETLGWSAGVNETVDELFNVDPSCSRISQVSDCFRIFVYQLRQETID